MRIFISLALMCVSGLSLAWHAARAGQAIAPAGLVRTLSRLTGPLAAAARRVSPYLAAFRVQWDDVASARRNLQRAAMAAGMLWAV